MSAKFQDIIQSDKPILVDFFAEWCGPYKMMKPILSDLKQRMGDDLRILTIDVDKNPSIASAYKIQGVPTLMIFKNGKSEWRQSGVVSANDLQQIIKSIA